MPNEQETIKLIGTQGILPLFYHDDAATCIEVVKALYAGGVRVVEFTNRGANALKNFSMLLAARTISFPEMLLGIGTIKQSEEAQAFIDAGADFLVSPVFDAGVCDTAYMHKTLWIPGCMTPTEIHLAQQAGCSLVKLFPGNVLGPGFVSAIGPLFTNMAYVVTGGVEPEPASMKAWFDAGVCAVGLGSKLISNELFTSKNYTSLTEKSKAVLSIVHSIKNKQ